jgi:hypothetical protein
MEDRQPCLSRPDGHLAHRTGVRDKLAACRPSQAGSLTSVFAIRHFDKVG